MEQSHLFFDTSKKQHFPFISILKVIREKMICPLVALSSKEGEPQRRCLWVAGETTKRGERIFG